VVVNGDHVTAYGLFVEHYQKIENDLERRGRQGRLLPERDAVRPGRARMRGWRPHRVDGYPAFKVAIR
jgi:hypothetical protein